MLINLNINYFLEDLTLETIQTNLLKSTRTKSHVNSSFKILSLHPCTVWQSRISINVINVEFQSGASLFDLSNSELNFWWELLMSTCPETKDKIPRPSLSPDSSLSLRVPIFPYCFTELHPNGSLESDISQTVGWNKGIKHASFRIMSPFYCCTSSISFVSCQNRRQ